MFVVKLSRKQYDRRMVGFDKNSYTLPQMTIPNYVNCKKSGSFLNFTTDERERVCVCNFFFFLLYFRNGSINALGVLLFFKLLLFKHPFVFGVSANNPIKTFFHVASFS